MAITDSVGYEGTVGYDTYSQTVTQAGRYTVEGTGDWKVSAIAGDRMVRVAAGVGRGYGIRDTSTNTDLQHDIVLAGVRYDLVVAHRDWSTGETEFQIINGGSTATLPSRATSPGAADDQPLALVRITSGSTVPVVVADLRCWSGDGGVVAVDALALDYLEEHPGTRVTIAGDTYTRVLTAAGAAYWDINKTSDNSLGPRPSVLIRRATALAFPTTYLWLAGTDAALTEALYSPESVMSATMGNTQAAPARITIAQAGLYSFGFRAAIAAPSSFRANAWVTTFSGGRIDPGNETATTSMEYPGGGVARYLSDTDTRWLRAGTQLAVRLDVNGNITVQNWRLWATWLGN